MIITHENKEYDLGRIFGGIVWPRENPGFAVIVGEDRLPEIGSRLHHCYVLAEVEEHNQDELIRHCTRLAKQFRTDKFFGRVTTGNRRSLYLWYDKYKEPDGAEFDVSPPVNAFKDGSIAHYFSLIKGKTTRPNKTLHFLNSGKLVDYIQRDISKSMAGTAKDHEYPAIAALGYAVEYLETFLPNYEECDEDNHGSYVPDESGIDRETGY